MTRGRGLSGRAALSLLRLTLSGRAALSLLRLTLSHALPLALGLHHRGVNSLKERIKNVLVQNWVPDDEEHAEKIYYVSGFVLRVIERLGKRAKGDVATVLDDNLSNARATKEEVKESDLPTRLTEVKEKVSLFYVNKSFYNLQDDGEG